jgi:two-component sensor histidine kinase/DNA-binding response OmpR family regulator
MTVDANSKVNLLLVDDQPGKLLSYEVMLGELGENLIKTSSAREALEVLLKTDVAVILIDVCMPEQDGFELAHMIRDHPRFQSTAIIFISAIHISEADSLRGYDAGAVDYVPVPVVPEVLRAKVKVFAELYRKTHQLEQLNRELETRVADRTAALEASSARLIESEQGLSLALAAGNMGSWEYDLEDESWIVDEGQFRIFGVDSDIRHRPRGFVKSLFHAEDWERLLQSLKCATPDDRTFQAEVRIVRQSGEIRWCLVAAAVSFDDEGNARRVRGVTIDITDRKEAERRQALLAREVDHRARNALAIVQAIVRLARAPTISEYVAGLEGRIGALALSHELLSQSRWQGADISRLVAEEFAPFQSGGICRAEGEGPAIILPTDKAQSIALLIHELATNAAKYGALSVDSGRVHLKWDLCDGCLSLVWTETGGPPVQQPKTKGFGTKIIEASLNARQGDGAKFEWLPEGLRCTIVVSVVARPEEQASPPPRAANGIDHPSPGRRLQVLVVEDEALVGMLTGELVSELGHTVLGPCRNLDEAINVARGNHLDGAILDVNLDGELVFPLARLLAERGVPMIFLTGYDRCAVEQGFERFPVLQKPVPAGELSKALASILDPSPEGRPVKAKMA